MIDHAQSASSDPLLDQSIFFNAFQSLSDTNIPEDTKIVVIIDDLDRYFPDRAIKLLESIKLVLAQPGFIFFLGVARRVLEGYLQHRYEKEYGVSEFEGQNYSDKIVQLPFHIPPHDNRIEYFWQSIITRLAEEDQPDFKALIPIIGLASGSNPRSAVRVVNNLLVDRAIYDVTKNDETTLINLAFFAVSRSLQRRWPGTFSLISQSDELCDEWANRLDLITNGGPSSTIAYILGYPLENASDILETDQDLKNLLASTYGLNWLRDHESRRTTVDFLQAQRSDSSKDVPQRRLRCDAFLSYPNQSSHEAKIIHDNLTNLGLRLFDPHNAVAIGPSLTEEILGGLKESEGVIVLVPASRSLSDIALITAGVAAASNRWVIPILLPGATLASVPFEMQQMRTFAMEKVNLHSTTSLYWSIMELKIASERN